MLNDSIKKFDKVLTDIIKIITIAMFSLLSLLYFCRIIFRLLLIKFSFHWSDELIELCFAGIVFLGSTAVWMAKGHFSAGNFIIKLFKKRVAISIYKILLEIVSLVFVIIFLKYSYSLTIKSREYTMVLEIPMKVLYGVMPVSALIMCLYSLRFLIFEIICLFKPDMQEGEVTE
ncbi:MAG: TRAP transporter small permease subunit [Spirochaetales bacterium]|nr:TRAP transporter small permease subunit [Spirochaetales bacterium]